METRTAEFNTGSEVIYGLHGRCAIKSIETKEVGGSKLEFYKLEPIKNPIIKPITNKKETAIWLPVQTAKKRGLRLPIQNQNTIEEVYKILENREFYFTLKDPWRELQPKLEQILCEEGAIGLAKALSCTYGVKHNHVVPPSEVNKFYDTLLKLLAKEIGEVVGQPLAPVEEDLERRLKNKLRPDS